MQHRHLISKGSLSVAWSSESRRVASASPPSLQVWTPNLSDPTFLRSWTPPPGTSASVLTWAPGPHLVAAFTGQIMLLDDSTGQVLQTFPAQMQGEDIFLRLL